MDFRRSSKTYGDVTVAMANNARQPSSISLNEMRSNVRLDFNNNNNN